MTDMEAVRFQRRDPYERTTLPWREYRMTETISDKEKEMVKNNERLIDIWGNKMRDLRSDFVDQLNEEVYKDGNASGNSERWHGLESIFGTSTATTTQAFASSSESYAGLTFAGKHDDVAPRREQKAYTPVIVNEEYTGWDSWLSAPLKIARRLVSACTVQNRRTGRPDMMITTESRYLQFLDKLQAEERILARAPTPEKQFSGFKGVEFDGIPLVWDYDCTADCTYCLNFDQIEVKVLKKQLIAMRTAFDIERNAHLTVMYLYGNMWIHPRYQGKSITVLGP